jgi:AcrR family transcriptional regulator
MASSVKAAGTVEYPRRHAKATITRARVIAAATSLFVERGYVAATIGSIAERADVSVETIYSTFGNKRALLSAAVDVSISGIGTARPILEQDWVPALRAEPDPRRRLRILATNGRAILERRGAMDEVVRHAAATDPQIAALRDVGKAQRLAGQRELLRIVIGGSSLRRGLDLDAAADAIYAIGSPETYRLLVVDRGWTGDRFEQWYGDTLERILFDDD